MILTKEQKAVVEDVLIDIKRKDQVTVGGLAGTGKTTILDAIVRKLVARDVNVLVCTPTGKAADVLRKKGVEAQTVHSACYQLKKKTTEPRTIVKDGEEVEIDVVTGMSWRFKGFDADVLLMDESSMVNDRMYQDILKAGMQVVFFGDHGQLPPVNSSFNLMASPHYRLETIHRNAGPVARYCDHLRRGNRPAAWADGGVTVTGSIPLDTLMKADQIICGTNKTRVSINAAVRKALGRKHLLEAGDRIVSLKNDRKLELCNGTQAVVLETTGQTEACIETADGRILSVE